MKKFLACILFASAFSGVATSVAVGAVSESPPVSKTIVTAAKNNIFDSQKFDLVFVSLESTVFTVATVIAFDFHSVSGLLASRIKPNYLTVRMAASGHAIRLCSSNARFNFKQNKIRLGGFNKFHVDPGLRGC